MQQGMANADSATDFYLSATIPKKMKLQIASEREREREEENFSNTFSVLFHSF